MNRKLVFIPLALFLALAAALFTSFSKMGDAAFGVYFRMAWALSTGCCRIRSSTTFTLRGEMRT